MNKNTKATNQIDSVRQAADLMDSFKEIKGIKMVGNTVKVLGNRTTFLFQKGDSYFAAELTAVEKPDLDDEGNLVVKRRGRKPASEAAEGDQAAA